MVWPRAVVQLRVVHLIRATLRYASKRDGERPIKDLRLICPADNEPAAATALEPVKASLSARYPSIVKL